MTQPLLSATWWIAPDTLTFEEKQKDEEFDEWYDGDGFNTWKDNNTWEPVWENWQFMDGRINLRPSSTYCLSVMNMTKVLTDITPFLEKQGYSISVRIKTRSDFKYTIATDKGNKQFMTDNGVNGTECKSKKFDACAIYKDSFMIMKETPAYPPFPDEYLYQFENDRYWNPFYPPTIPYQKTILFENIDEIRITFIDKNMCVVINNLYGYIAQDLMVGYILEKMLV